MSYHSYGSIDFRNLERLNKDNFMFEKINYWEKYPNQPFDGVIKKDEKYYFFELSHEFDCGNTYVAYDSLNEDPIFFFAIYMGEDETTGNDNWLGEDEEGDYTVRSWEKKL